MLVVSYNPGYQNFLKGMKPSTRQRFISLAFDFPPAAQEEAILVGESGIDAMTAKRLVSIANAFRTLRDHDLEEVASTRLLVYAASLIKDGCEPTLACRAALVETLTDDPETAVALREVIDATFGR
jgi:nitric oxide reductase NorQ protein